MKNLFKSLMAVAIVCSSFSAHAANTDQKVVERVQITESGVLYLRPVGLGAWGGDECPDAVYAYISKSAPAFENILSMAIASKLNGSKMAFIGTCNDAGSYIKITYAYLI